VGGRVPAHADERTVLAVVTCDSYADLKRQFGWLGAQVGQPGLPGMLESVLLMATQGRGLAGLDVKRPLGAVLTTDGGDIAVHGFVPVKSLDKLLDSLQAVTGPTEHSGETRSLTLPSGVALNVKEKDGWAIVSPRGIDAEAVDPQGRSGFLERFIHGEIYKMRPDVMSIVHSHSPSVVPFSLVPNKMQAMYHNAAFIAEGVPVFDIREKFGATDMLVGNHEKGRELARVLGQKPVCLMRAHGSVAVGPSLKHAVFRAVYTEVNAKLQSEAMRMGEVTYLNEKELVTTTRTIATQINRAWDFWRMRAEGKL
jgi:ribulose-5-phosphate 4-epimerase/fuculose-1-phosphate aldolase